MNLRQYRQDLLLFTSKIEGYIIAFFVFLFFIYKIFPKYMLFPIAFPVILYSLWQLGKSRLKPCPVIK